MQTIKGYRKIFFDNIFLVNLCKTLRVAPENRKYTV